MAENTQPPEFEDVRRAGLNPLSDYGGREGMDIANRAIAQHKKEFENTSSNIDGEQLSLLAEDSTDINPEAVAEEKPTRAVLGSRALKGTVTVPREIELPRKTAREQELDRIAKVQARRQLRKSFDNNRGRNPGS